MKGTKRSVPEELQAQDIQQKRLDTTENVQKRSRHKSMDKKRNKENIGTNKFLKRTQSMQNTVHNAVDPAEHLDRLVDGGLFFTESIVEPTATADNTETTDGVPDDSNDIRELLSSSAPNFAQIFSILSSLEEPWTYVYKKGQWRLPESVEIVYFRPKIDGSKADLSRLFKDEDYFIDRASLIDYLLVQFGLQVCVISFSYTTKLQY